MVKNNFVPSGWVPDRMLSRQRYVSRDHRFDFLAGKGRAPNCVNLIVDPPRIGADKTPDHAVPTTSLLRRSSTLRGRKSGQSTGCR